MAVVVGVGGLGGHFDVFIGGIFDVRWVVAGCLVVVLVVEVGVCVVLVVGVVWVGARYVNSWVF